MPEFSKPKPLPKIPEFGEYAIDIKGLTFAYDQKPDATVLDDLNMSLPTGSRCLLIGANGSGKSTLMRILAGRHLTKAEGGIKVLGMNAFRDTKLNFHRAYLDCDWGMRTVAFVGSGSPLSKFLTGIFIQMFFSRQMRLTRQYFSFPNLKRLIFQ